MSNPNREGIFWGKYKGCTIRNLPYSTIRWSWEGPICLRTTSLTAEIGTSSLKSALLWLTTSTTTYRCSTRTHTNSETPAPLGSPHQLALKDTTKCGSLPTLPKNMRTPSLSRRSTCKLWLPNDSSKSVELLERQLSTNRSRSPRAGTNWSHRLWGQTFNSTTN